MFKERTCAKAMVAAALLLATGSGVLAFGLKQDKSRFDDLNIHQEDDGTTTLTV